MSWLSLLTGPPPQARIAPARRNDVARLSEIHGGAFARPWGPDEFDGFLSDPTVRIDALFLGRSRLPAGFVVSRLAADEAEILSIALAQPARRQGHARRLLSHHLSVLEHAGAARVHLEVEEGNDAALALYRGLRFEQSGLRPGYYARPDGTRTSALSMTRRFARDTAVAG